MELKKSMGRDSVTSGANIVIKSVLPFLSLISHNIQVVQSFSFNLHYLHHVQAYTDQYYVHS